MVVGPRPPDRPPADPPTSFTEGTKRPALEPFQEVGGLFAGAPAREEANNPETETLPPPKAEPPAATLAIRERGTAKPSAGKESKDPLAVRKEIPSGMAAAIVRGPGLFQRLDRSTEEELRKALADVPEVGLGKSGPAVLRSYYNSYKMKMKESGSEGPTDPTPLLVINPAVRYLPLYFGGTSKLSPKAAQTLGELARKLHQYLDNVAPMDEGGNRPRIGRVRDTLLGEMRGQKPEWLRAEAIPSLMQLLMPEERSVRLLLVELLSEIPERPATLALAQRAVFDIDPDVRQAAVAVLKKRAPNDYRPVLLKALQYPWLPPAQHAAEALVELKDREAVPYLVTLLDKPDPAGPQKTGKGQWSVREVVKAQHVTNCMMCHPPSVSLKEPVLMEDPSVPLPSNMVDPYLKKFLNETQGQLSIIPACSEGNMMGKGPRLGLKYNGPLPLGIRGDITFVRQDFSVRQPVAQPLAVRGPLAAPVQRFDYVVRTRPLSKNEIAQLNPADEDNLDYPQRDAVLFALRELTGRDAGKETAAWRELFPREIANAEARELARDLLKSAPAKQLQMLAKWKDAKEPIYTQALIDAIADIKGEVKKTARAALAERMARLTPTELREQLGSDDADVRQLAAAACATKGVKELTPDLIALLEDTEPLVVRAAEGGLRTLTGMEFDTPEAWKEWWTKQSGD
jgi:HEAT repeat protein